MDIVRIRYFSALAELEHVRKAAEVLGINSATLSRAIKVLEHEVGFKLIAPSGRGIEITEQGKQFYRQSRALIQEYTALQTSLANPTKKGKKTIRLGSMEVFTTYFLTAFMKNESFIENLRVLYLTPGKIEDALKSRDIDVGITYLRLAEEELNYLKVGEFQMQIFGCKAMKSRRFEELPFAVPIDSVNTPAVSLRSLDGWPSEEHPRQVKFELELLETALQFARSGKAVVYCPNFVVKLHNQALPTQLHLHEISPPIGFKTKRLSTFIVRRKNEEETKLIRSLAKMARALT